MQVMTGTKRARGEYDEDEHPIVKSMKLEQVDVMLGNRKPNKPISDNVAKTPVVVYADDINFDKHIALRMYTNKKKGFKMVKLQVSKDNCHPIRIQFGNVPGYIPKKFGVETNKHGKTNLTFSIPCEKEYDAILTMQNKMKEYAKQSKSEWWNYDITDNQIEDNFFNLITTNRKEKDDGTGLWPGNMKVSIPIDDNGQLSKCHIFDENNKNISLYDLPGRKWDTIVVEISGIYFQNKYSWGFGPKKLRYIKLAPDQRQDIENVDFENIALAKKSDF